MNTTGISGNATYSNNLADLLDRLATILKTKTSLDFAEKVENVLCQAISVLTTSQNFVDPGSLLQTLRQVLTLDPINYSLRITEFSSACIVYYQNAIATNSNTSSQIAELHYALGNIHAELNHFNEAISSYTLALQLNPNYAEVYFSLGNLDMRHGQRAEAIVNFQTAIKLNPNFAKPYVNLACIQEKQGNLAEALANLEIATQAKPDFAEAHRNLGSLLIALGKPDEAIASLHRALALKPDDANAHMNLGIALTKQKAFDAAIASLQTAISLQPNYVEAYYNLGATLFAQGKFDEAIVCFQEALQINPRYARTHASLGSTLAELGNAELAIAHCQQALQIDPSIDINTYRLSQLALPILYDTESDIAAWRQRFTKGLHNFVAYISHKLETDPQYALNAIEISTNFYLAYQGQNDLELQSQYGKLLHRVMSANYPQWANLADDKRALEPANALTRKIRIGYVSYHFRNHTISKLFLGWLQHRDRHGFEAFVYHIGETSDLITEQFQKNSDRFQHIPNNIAAVCEQIQADSLDVLVFTDIGMDRQSIQIAALRLAPIQCVAWGHPVTTGLPTIDYFLSSELMEPEEAAETHYSETLIRLPKLGISYSRPSVPTVTKTRADFQLLDTDLVYLSCQSLFKYLPQHDGIFASIAQLVPTAKFVFLSHPTSKYATEKFRQRLQKAFMALGLDSKQYCIIMSSLNLSDYLNLNQLSDVYLDTLDWSGGNTTLEAIACGLPVVTYPGKFMRGRHTYAFLKVMEIAETIAESKAEYIEISAKLGLDAPWRQAIVQKMRQRLDLLYGDRVAIKALEQFYQEVVSGSRFS